MGLGLGLWFTVNSLAGNIALWINIITYRKEEKGDWNNWTSNHLCSQQQDHRSVYLNCKKNHTFRHQNMLPLSKWNRKRGTNSRMMNSNPNRSTDERDAWVEVELLFLCVSRMNGWWREGWVTNFLEWDGHVQRVVFHAPDNNVRENLNIQKLVDFHSSDCNGRCMVNGWKIRN